MFKSSQVKSFDRLPYGCLLFMYRLDLNVNSHRRCTTIRLVSYGTGSTVNVEGNLKRRAAILLYADPRPGTGRGRRAPRAHTVIRSSQRPVSRHAESRKRDSGCANAQWGVSDIRRPGERVHSSQHLNRSTSGPDGRRETDR